ncbi:hypothetical protein D3C87_1299190 [compost metagenome]
MLFNGLLLPFAPLNWSKDSEINGIPSTIYKGSLPPIIEFVPLKRTLYDEPGKPLVPEISKPATRPCSAAIGLEIG